MAPWRKETLNLKVGDFIIWQDEAIELEGQPVAPGMKGEVISLAFIWMSPRANPSRPRRLCSSRLGCG